jgi:hypothetical protein
MSEQDKKGICASCTKFWDDLADVRKHVLNAEKEFLLAVRSVVDLLVQKTEDFTPPKKARKVNIK